MTPSAPTPFARALTAAGLTVAELHYRLARAGHRIALPTLEAWKRGARSPRMTPALAAVCEILRKSPTELWGRPTGLEGTDDER